MQVEQSIQPINVTAATLIVQLLFLVIISIGAKLYKVRRWAMPPISSGDPRDLPSGLLRTTPVTFLALSSFTLLMLTDDLYTIWSPLFQGVEVSTFNASTSIFLVYLLNLMAVFNLILRTGGSASSPFVAALFTLPALAIFLRMPPWAFTAIATISVISYLILLAPSLEGRQPSYVPTAFLNISCLALAMLTGYFTRPIPITELKRTTQHQNVEPKQSGNLESHVSNAAKR